MKIQNLIDFMKSTQASKDGYHWHPVRPLTSENTFLKLHIKMAWKVLIGKADAIEWGDWE